MDTEPDDLPASDEQKHLQSALKKCKELEQNLQLSLVQVMLLNRKYCAYSLEKVSTSSSRTLFDNTLDLTIPSRRRSEVHIRTDSGLLENYDLRLTTSLPVLRQSRRRLSDGCRPMQMYRTLNMIVLNSNEINVQVIKIRRHFEGVLVRVEYLVRMYCKNSRLKSIGDRQQNGRQSGKEIAFLQTVKSHQCCGKMSMGR